MPPVRSFPSWEYRKRKAMRHRTRIQILKWHILALQPKSKCDVRRNAKMKGKIRNERVCIRNSTSSYFKYLWEIQQLFDFIYLCFFISVFRNFFLLYFCHFGKGNTTITAAVATTMMMLTTTTTTMMTTTIVGSKKQQANKQTSVENWMKSLLHRLSIPLVPLNCVSTHCATQ